MCSWPQNAREWWDLCRANADALRELVRGFHPANFHPASVEKADQVKRFPITAQAAEKLCEMIRQEIVKESSGTDPVGTFDLYLNHEDDRMPNLLNEVWFGLPESVEVRTVAGFGTLCDLCSEAGILFEGKEELEFRGKESHHAESDQPSFQNLPKDKEPGAAEVPDDGDEPTRYWSDR